MKSFVFKFIRKDVVKVSPVLAHNKTFYVEYIKTQNIAKILSLCFKMKDLKKHMFKYLKLNIFNQLASANPKRKAFQTLLMDYRNKLLEDKMKDNLRKLLRKYVITKLLKTSKEYNHFAKLLYFLRVLFMHKNTNKAMFIKMIIVKWNFITKLQVASKKSMKNVYGNMHSYYLDVANNLAGDNNKSVMNSMFDFSNHFTDVLKEKTVSHNLKIHLEEERELLTRMDKEIIITNTSYACPINDTTTLDGIGNESVMHSHKKDNNDFNFKKEMDLLINPEKIEREKRLSKLKNNKVTEYKWVTRNDKLIRIPMLNETNTSLKQVVKEAEVKETITSIFII